MPFQTHLVWYLQANELTTLLGLQVLGKQAPDNMCEFIIQNNGTVMLDSKELKNWTPHRVTGFMSNQQGAAQPREGETHAKTVRGTHQVFTNDKIGGEECLMDLLRAEDILPATN